jgi:hypothetical protein
MTEMASWEFLDEYDDVDNDEKEPSFSLYDFKKWLDSHQPDAPSSFRESIEERKREGEVQSKDSLKEEFKKRMRDKVKRNVEKKLAERKKKKR